jgi:N-ethylmaleimide reductase
MPAKPASTSSSCTPHGYLLHQFLTPSANSAKTATAAALKTVRASCSRRWMPPLPVERRARGYRVFPLGGFNGVDNGEDQEAAGLYLIRELAKRNLAYLHLSEPDWAGGKPLRDEFRQAIRAAYPGVIIAAGAYTAEKAKTSSGAV